MKSRQECAREPQLTPEKSGAQKRTLGSSSLVNELTQHIILPTLPEIEKGMVVSLVMLAYLHPFKRLRQGENDFFEEVRGAG